MAFLPAVFSNQETNMNNKKTLNAYIDLLCREGLADQVSVLDEANMTADVEYVSYNSMDVKPGTRP